MGRKGICRVCKRERKNRNRRGVCLNCAINKNRAAVRQLRAKKGKHYDKWRKNILEAIERQPT